MITTILNNNNTEMALPSIPSRFPFDHKKMLGTKLPQKELAICPNPSGTNPVPYKNYRSSHHYGQIESPTDKIHLIWYMWEFIGHLWYLSYDFDSFIKKIAENERADGPSESDFTNYFTAMITDSNSVYNRHMLTHFDVMWAQCEGNQEIWNAKLSNLRNAFNNYIEGCMSSYKDLSEHSLYKKWRETLTPIYGDNWTSYLWQCATFDELGRFIIEHNKYFKKTEDAKEMLCHLQIPEQTFNMAGFDKQRVAFIDDSYDTPETLHTIRIWVHGYKFNGKTYAYPATPQEWVRGGFGIMANYSTHTSIFPNGASNWLKKCKEKGVIVKLFVMQNNEMMVDTGKINFYSNKKEFMNILEFSKSQRNIKANKPVCGKNESLADFADRMVKWNDTKSSN
jgi:hypothetical protein